MDSADSFLAVLFLCVLFVVLFTILGLHIFGDLLLDIESPNFHGFFQSFLTTFQVCHAVPVLNLVCVPAVHIGPCFGTPRSFTPHVYVPG